jgi:hypothetical protein
MLPVPRIYIPLKTAASYTPPGAVPGFGSLIRTVTFEKKHVPEIHHFFYECTVPGCHGAGLESLPEGTQDVPDFILEAMKLHVELCEGLVRAKVSQ